MEVLCTVTLCRKHTRTLTFENCFQGGVPQKLAPHVPGVNLNVAKPTTDLERQMKESGAIPGPGQYGAPMQVREKEQGGGGERQAGRQAGR